MQSVENKIEKAINKKRKGSLFFPEDFTVLGSSEAIRKALQRLEEKEKIKRVAQGIYVCPKTSKYIGELTPSAEEVAIAIAKRDKNPNSSNRFLCFERFRVKHTSSYENSTTYGWFGKRNKSR